MLKNSSKCRFLLIIYCAETEKWMLFCNTERLLKSHQKLAYSLFFLGVHSKVSNRRLRLLLRNPQPYSQPYFWIFLVFCKERNFDCIFCQYRPVTFIHPPTQKSFFDQLRGGCNRLFLHFKKFLKSKIENFRLRRTIISLQIFWLKLQVYQFDRRDRLFWKKTTSLSLSLIGFSIGMTPLTTNRERERER